MTKSNIIDFKNSCQKQATLNNHIFIKDLFHLTKISGGKKVHDVVCSISSVSVQHQSLPGPFDIGYMDI
jgi:hypothetical protein